MLWVPLTSHGPPSLRFLPAVASLCFVLAVLAQLPLDASSHPGRGKVCGLGLHLGC